MPHRSQTAGYTVNNLTANLVIHLTKKTTKNQTNQKSPNPNQKERKKKTNNQPNHKNKGFFFCSMSLHASVSGNNFVFPFS